jgi:hypothetical protein
MYGSDLSVKEKEVCLVLEQEPSVNWNHIHPFHSFHVLQEQGKNEMRSKWWLLIAAAAAADGAGGAGGGDPGGDAGGQQVQ